MLNRMEMGLGSSHVQLGDHLLYDRFTIQPVWVLEQGLAACMDRKGYPDRNLSVGDRADIGHYEVSKTYRPCWLHSSIAAFSHASPVTRGLWEIYLELDQWILNLDGKLSSAQGPLYKAQTGGAKWYRLSDDGPVIPHGIWRSVLQERDNHQLRCHSFIVANIVDPVGICDAATATAALERKLGWELWGTIRDEQFQKGKAKATRV